jgi:hypothetical protein
MLLLELFNGLVSYVISIWKYGRITTTNPNSVICGATI